MSSEHASNLRFRPGAMLGGKFAVERVLGAGGMGLVLAAHHRILDRRVALKVLLPEAGASTAAAQRFVREARALAQLHSPHVARVLDVGVFDDGLPFMVMELLEGEDLQTALSRCGPLQVSDAVDVILQACEGLREAHGLGIVHRDLKPANLFLARTPDGKTILKIIDFGIAKSTARADQAITMTRDVVGSPLYMSPEQIKAAKDVDVRSDIWTLGVVLFELVTGTPPFSAETFGEVFAAILRDPIPDASTRSRAVPASLDRVIARCLERDIEKRWPSVQELAAALGPFASPDAVRRALAGESARSLVITGASPVNPDQSAALSVANTVANTGVETLVGPGGRGKLNLPIVFASAAVVVALVVAGGRAWTLANHRAPGSPDPSAPLTHPPASSAPPVASEAPPEPLTEPPPPPTASNSATAAAPQKPPARVPPAVTTNKPRPAPTKKPATDVLEGRD